MGETVRPLPGISRIAQISLSGDEVAVEPLVDLDAFGPAEVVLVPSIRLPQESVAQRVVIDFRWGEGVGVAKRVAEEGVLVARDQPLMESRRLYRALDEAGVGKVEVAE